VVGGGTVAWRKVKVLTEHGAEVRVISPELCPELRQMAAKGNIEALTREYEDGDLAGAFVVIAATDDTNINEQISKEAERRDQLVNVVDDAARSNFIVPSYLRRGDITIAVSTAGRSPALARKIRTELEEHFGDEYAALARLVKEVRTEFIDQGVTVSSQRWQQALDIDSLNEMLAAGKKKEARAVLLGRLEEED
jgi:siroheme synthase-like protein